MDPSAAMNRNGVELEENSGCEIQQTTKAKDPTVTDMLDMMRIDVELEPAVDKPDTLCSKNVFRKQRNWEKKLAAKRCKRKEEKRRRRQNRQEKGTCMDHPQFSKRVTKAITKERLAEARATGPKLCVDLSMTDSMSRKEISRLAGQIRRLYGSNRKALQPFHLFLTDLREDSLLYKECLRMNDGFLHYLMEVTEDSWLDLFPSENVIYLTPDAEEALESVDGNKVYILGGLVDERIQKKLSYTRAREHSVHTARLPIDEYMVKRSNPKNFHSKILAINQVFEILLTFCDTGSWTQALDAGIPHGKGYMIAPEAIPEVNR